MMNSILAKLRRVAATQGRVVATMVAARLPERPRQCRYQGWEFSYPSRSLVGRAVARGVVWDQHLVEVVRSLPARSVVCEVGSNIGASLLTMARARDDLRFVCFEPSTRFLPYLLRNVERNGLSSRVEVLGVLVGPEGEEFQLTSNTSTGSVVSGKYDRHIPLETSTLPATSIDRQFADREDPSFVKIDTDGFELHVLRSGREVLARAHPTLFVEYTPELLARVGGSGAELQQFLLDVGYTAARVYRGDGVLLEQEHSLQTPIATRDWVDLIVTH